MFVIVAPSNVKPIDVTDAIVLSRVKAIIQEEFLYRVIFENELEAAKS